MKRYTAGRVFVGDGRVLTPGGVLVEGGVITGLDERPSRVDFPGATLHPGFIDAHVHLGFDGGGDPVATLRAASDAELLESMRQAAKALLSAGVTTARDLGSRGFLDIALRESLDAPRLLLATRPLTPPGGHCWYLGGEGRGAGELRKLVRENQEAGADWIKVMVTGGHTTEGSRAWRTQFDRAELAAAVDEAHALGLPVAAHAHGTGGIALAVDCGVDTLEHCTWQTEDGSGGYSPRIADAIAAAGIPVCATFNPQLAAIPAFAGPRRRVIADMRARGVRFIAGTDAGVVGTPHAGFGDGLKAMAGYGFTPGEVLRSATIDSAKALGIDGRTGSLLPGKDADLVISSGGRPLLVVARGREIR
ncbi:amidohydrolase family protein [Amycolatopsis sp.]|uniref:amidohydrolase family protein n=1 Tax=Amycolatopsis sp. TaxID=37632 RepID=UPI002C47B623|nr:amidohydrolase family protein [Amycolatopsis sp.]HVV12558.1 amidohydrolase family protein [Amycolatopsis sp.]